jgi:branched-chain amino acid transport system permease protein
MSIDFLAMIIIGGLGSIAGAVAGAVLVTALPLVLGHYSDVLGFLAEPGEAGVGAAEAARLLYGAAVVAVLLFARGGLAQLLSTLRRRFARSRRPTHEVKEPSHEANSGIGEHPVSGADRL